MDKKINDAGVEDKFKYNHHVYGVTKNSDGVLKSELTMN